MLSINTGSSKNARPVLLLRSSLFILMTALWSATTLQGQEAAPLKREFRGVWVATVLNLDYPKSPTTWPTAQKEGWRNLLDKLKATGFNAVVAQVRPAADAFYPSTHAPWSAYLTGKQGLPPKPAYDVLEFMIEEAHKRGMDFHAWLNPYRVSMDLDTTKLSAGHVFYQHRDWIVPYGNRYYLNPGLPPVREHLSGVIAELASQYDIDGIHFDDYFYPYPVAGAPFPDSLTFAQYGATQFDTITDWRRDNVNRLIGMVDSTLEQHAPYAEFGVSPFGVWRNQSEDPKGSATQASIGAYDALYADALHWAEEGWIDYLVPQLYWHIGFEIADHAELQRWWSRHKGKAKLYIGHAAYKVGRDKMEQWLLPDELPRQLQMGRSNPDIDGGIFFRAASTLYGGLGVRDSLQAAFSTPALLPAHTYNGLRIPAPPRMKRAKARRQGTLLKWKFGKGDRKHRPHYYVVYRFEGKQAGSTDQPEAIVHFTEFGAGRRQYKFTDTTTKPGRFYTYLIVGLNRAHREGAPGQAATVQF
ncbi:MAG: family 10 glycosylhydrolase [Phaeodactylibacter sp.]|uniref:glycoside hydrolase family 10 protein n=1 Tax=Phaeodactylibacter sp. TaxID=1940289 RepID=UPI0032ED516F